MVKVRVIKKGRQQILGKIYMRKDGEFELPDAVAAPLIKQGIIAPAVNPLIPEAAAEEVAELRQKVVELEGIVKEKDTQIEKLSAELISKTADGQKKDSEIDALKKKK